MNTTVKKIIFSLFITSLTLLLSACTKVENNTPEELEERFKIVTKTFMEPFENGELELYGKYSTKTIPNIEMVLESVFNADQRLLALKKPNYEKFEGVSLMIF